MISGTSVYVAWRDKRSGLADVYFNRSLDSGATWLASDVRINTGVPAGTADARNAELAASQSTVYLVWWDDRNATGGVHDVFVQRSLDRGTTWPVAPTRLDTDVPGAADSQSPHLAASASSAFVVWSEFRNGDSDIYMNRTSDHGATWLAADVKIDNAATGISSGDTQIAASGSSVYVTYQDDSRRPFNSLKFNHSVDGGVTWLHRELHLLFTGQATALRRDMAVSGASVYVAWDDVWSARQNPTEIHFSLPFGFVQYGVGKPGSGGIAPSIAGSGEAAMGRTVSIDITNGLGGAPGGLLIGGPGTKTAIPFLGGTLLVNHQAHVSFTLSGPIGVPGAGTFSLPIALPLNPAFLSMVFYFQPGVLDAGASFSLSLGNAIEMWVG